MIYGILAGGLGNQLFQIFNTIALSIRMKQPFGFPKAFTASSRHTYWDTFLKPLVPFTHDTLPSSYAFIFRETYFHYIPIVVEKRNNIYIEGYFQSDKYFFDYYLTISKLIKLEEHRLQMSMQCHTVLETSEDFPLLISLHVRLGDYLKLQDYHTHLSIDYYRNAIDYIIRMTNVDNLKILYFCDENPEDACENYYHTLSSDYPLCLFVPIFKENTRLTDWQQMLLMSLCHHHIIANSTFSWWGSYFNPSTEKMICYPDKWFGVANEYKDVRDLFDRPYFHKII